MVSRSSSLNPYSGSVASVARPKFGRCGGGGSNRPSRGSSDIAKAILPRQMRDRRWIDDARGDTTLHHKIAKPATDIFRIDRCVRHARIPPRSSHVYSTPLVIPEMLRLWYCTEPHKVERYAWPISEPCCAMKSHGWHVVSYGNSLIGCGRRRRNTSPHRCS